MTGKGDGFIFIARCKDKSVLHPFEIAKSYLIKFLMAQT